MKPFYYTQLPVLGQIGPKSHIDRSGISLKVHQLQCILDSIPDSDIFAVYGAIIATETLVKRFTEMGCSGLAFHEGSFDLHPNITPKSCRDRYNLPHLLWGQVTGMQGVDDFGLDRGTHLIVSEKVKVLIEANKHAGVRFFTGDRAPSDEEISRLLFEQATILVEETRKRRQAGRKT